LLLKTKLEQSENKNAELIKELSARTNELEFIKKEKLNIIENFKTKLEENENLLTQLNKYKAEVDELHLKTTELSGEIMIKNQVITEYANHIEETEIKIDELETELNNIKSNPPTIDTEQIKELKNQLLIEENEREKLQEKIKELEKLLTLRYEQINILENEYEQMKDKFENKINRLKNKLLDLKKLIIESN